MSVFYLTVGVISSVVWILVPFFKKQNKYFYYFAIIALSAAYGLVYLVLPVSIPTKTMVAITALSIPALFRGFFRKHIYQFIIIGIFIYALSHFISIHVIQSISTLLSMVLLFVLYFLLYNECKHESSFSKVLLLIMLYELLTSVKLSFLLINPYGLLIHYYIISIAQVFIGIGLTVVKDTNVRSILQ